MTRPYEYEDELSHSSGGGGKQSRGISSGAFKSRYSKTSYISSTGSRSPQAMMKIASHARGHRVMNVLEYISRTDREEGIELEDESGMRITGKDQVKELYQEWSEDFERAKPNAKRLPRHASHLILSADAKNTPENQDKVLEAARETCREMFGDNGFRYVIGLHQDGNKPHVHVAVNAYNEDKTLGKLRIGPAEIHEFRTKYAERLTEQGLEHVATIRRDRPELAKAMKEGKEPLKSKDKEQKYFFKSLGNHEHGEYFQSIERGACQFRKSINESSLEPKEKKYLRAKIREFELNLSKSPEKCDDHRVTLYKQCKQYQKQFFNELQGVVNPGKYEKQISDREKLSKLLDTKQDRDIGTARADIDKIKDPEERTRAKDNLQEFTSKLTGKSKGELLLQDTKETFKMVMDRIDLLDRESKNPKLSAVEKFQARCEKEKMEKGLEKHMKVKSGELGKMNRTAFKNEKEHRQILQQMRAMQMQLSKVLGLGLGR